MCDLVVIDSIDLSNAYTTIRRKSECCPFNDNYVNANIVKIKM